LRVDSMGGLSIPAAPPRIVINPHEHSFPAACGAGPPSWFRGWLCLWITLRDVPVYRMACPHLQDEMSPFTGGNVPVYRGEKSKCPCLWGGSGWRLSALCG
jgi:hypothetical protein